MRKFYTPIQDTTIYQQFPTRQTGFDEQLEVGKTAAAYSVRSLIQFDTSLFSSLPTGSAFELILYVSNATNLKKDQIVEVLPVSESWEGGTGYFYQDRIESNDGATWNSRENSQNWAITGSTFINTSSIAISTNPIKDFVFDVTDIVNSWVSGSYNNNGFVIKFPSSSESSLSNFGNIKFFSNETHTVFKPLLVAKFDDSLYVTGSLSSSVNLSQIKVQSNNLQKSYLVDEDVTIRLSVRELYPTKTFTDIFDMWGGKYVLPETSYYSLIDAQTNTVIIPFDDYSKISADLNGNYFRFSTKPLYPLRWYRLRYKVVRNGKVEYFDDPQLFTIRQV
jgi:hypothetical protein